MDYNENSFVSQLRQPSRIPSPGKLAEMTASANNARSSTMLPPPPGTLKRKTLVDRAGETSRPNLGPPNSRPHTAVVKVTSIAGLSRQTSFSSSTSSRPASVSSMRNVSNASLSSSVGSTRPPSSNGYRPHKTLSSQTSHRPGLDSVRPGSSMDAHLDHNRASHTNGTRNSMTTFHSAVRKRATSQESSLREVYGRPNNPVQDWSRSVTRSTSAARRVKSLRDISLSTALGALSLNQRDCVSIPEEAPETPCTPSQIPKKKLSKISLVTENTAFPSRSPKKPLKIVPFLTRESNIKALDWNLETRMEDIESSYQQLKEKMDVSNVETSGLKETIGLYKTKITELELIRGNLISNNSTLQESITVLQQNNSTWQQSLNAAKIGLTSSVQALEDAKKLHSGEIDEIKRQHRRDCDELREDAERQVRRLTSQHEAEINGLRRRLEDAIEEEKSRRRKEVEALSTDSAMARQRIDVELETKEKTLRSLREEIEQEKGSLNRERDLNSDLRDKLTQTTSNTIQLEASMRSMRARIDFLESDCKSQSQAFADLEQKTQDAIREADEARDKLRIEETLRRKLHNQVQELKGNIRVFCRVRPPLESDPPGAAARITFPDDHSDSKELEVMGSEEKSSLGNITTKKNPFTFDRVFAPASQNAEIFDEISQLVQSALDGYNVCIFCYGQTGAGKTFTMSSEDGMIPRAVRQIYETAKSLEEKGWHYTMEGSFVEVYNENINDLLGKAEEFDKKKHEIRHDMQKCKTTITDTTVVDLDSPSKVEAILRRAMSNRSVAATKANERSSRSHSVFILKLVGENNITGEKSEGTLNLVDLAGSERLSHSGSTGERLKETQNINKSLSCLGDVIGALGQGKEGGHVPYRNSKLTYLLQFSLGGNSKTLMFVMISPLQAHLSETLTSLKFATKVHNTHIGTAKRQAKVRET